MASKAVTAVGLLADRCFKAASKAGLGLAVGAGVSAAVLDGLTGLARASVAAATTAWGAAGEPVPGSNEVVQAPSSTKAGGGIQEQRLTSGTG